MLCEMCSCDGQMSAKSDGLLSYSCQKKHTNILQGVSSGRDVKLSPCPKQPRGGLNKSSI